MWLKISLWRHVCIDAPRRAFFGPAQRRRTFDGSDPARRVGPRLRLMSWNIGYGNLESDTRAHTEDLAAVAQVILKSDPDAVAIQEMIDEDQLKLLLVELKNRYSRLRQQERKG